MKTRIITGIVALSLLLPTVIYGGTIFYIVLAVFGAIGALEFANMYSTSDEVPLFNKIYMVLMTVSVFVTTASFDTLFANDITAQGVLAYFIFLIALTAMIYVMQSEQTSDMMNKYLFGSLYVGFGLASVYFLRSYHFAIFLYMLLAAFLSDIFAYFTGVFFGKNKMCPTISPKKTWEGFFGGLFFSVLFTTLYAFNLDTFFSDAEPTVMHYLVDDVNVFTNGGLIIILVVTTMIGAIVSVVGDLVASKIKREYGIKDYGKIFPGHGGVMDRFDSVILSSMIFISIFTFIEFISFYLG